MKDAKQHLNLIAVSMILLFCSGIAILHWYTRESTLLDVIGIESEDIIDASICDANNCIDTEVELNSEQIETVMQFFSRMKIISQAGSSIQNSYVRCFFETENHRYEVLLASNEVLINFLNDNKWFVYSITSPSNDLEIYMKNFFLT